MKNKLFIITLIVFIGLGLPDSILTATWPNIASFYNIKLQVISVYSIMVFIATFISTLLYPTLLRKRGFNFVVSTSIFLTFLGMFVIYLIQNPFFLGLGLIISGLGAGSIDSAINDYASQNFTIGKINVLHGFWGIGISTSSLLVGLVLTVGLNFRYAYLIVSVLLFIIYYTFVKNKELFVFKEEVDLDITSKKIVLKDLFAPFVIFFYNVEFFIGIYLTSYLDYSFNLEENIIAFILAMYWIGLTLSRILMPLTTKYIKEYKIIIISCFIALLSSLLLSMDNPYILMISLFLIGIGFGPIYPTMIHFTSKVVEENSDKIISLQIASWSLATLLSQFIFGYVSANYGFSSFIYIVIFEISILFILITLFVFSNYKKISRD